METLKEGMIKMSKKKNNRKGAIKMMNELFSNEPVNNEPVNENNEEEKKETIVRAQGYVNAAKLNVRREPNKDADVLTVISQGAGVGIDLTKSTEDFYCVEVVINSEVVSAYCMKQFITISE